MDTKTTDSRISPRIRVMGFFLQKRQADKKSYGRDRGSISWRAKRQADKRKPGGAAATL